MFKLFIFVLFVLEVIHALPVSRCPENFDFSSGRSCFKYVNDKMVRHDEAASHCVNVLGGRLAILNSKAKFKATVKFFYTKFQEEQEEEEGVPTAWVQGKWIPGTKHLEYDDESVNRHPHWMTPTHHRETGNLFRFPTHTVFGWEATCVAVSLWQPRTPGSRERSGLYNVPCNNIYFTHPLCEVTV